MSPFPTIGPIIGNPTVQSVRSALAGVSDPVSGTDVVSAGLISGIVVQKDKAGFVITIAPDTASGGKDRMEALRNACEEAVRAIPGITSVTAVLTAHNSEPIPAKPQSGYDAPRPRAAWNLTPVEGVRRVIAVASGKGGVGKSTLTVNLALALRDAGQQVGILDADIYGPSIPRMLGLASGTASRQPEIVDNRMQPLHAHGIACMSMGFITGEEAAILRGPMISKALHQMLRMTHWSRGDTSGGQPLDTLLVDMPPGTGDIHLSMVQQVPLSGAIIVTTPQGVATLDARKCLVMFQKVNVPVLGVVENMSGGLFGNGGGRQLAEQCGVPYLGTIPAEAAICEAADQGRAYDGDSRRHYQAIARQCLL